MAQRPDESAAQWYERAIVANSVAAGELDGFTETAGVNPAARAAIEKRAAAAEADLSRALDAFLAERRAAKAKGDG